MNQKYQLELFDEEGPCGWGSLSYFAIPKKKLTKEKPIEDNPNQLELDLDEYGPCGWGSLGF